MANRSLEKAWQDPDNLSSTLLVLYLDLFAGDEADQDEEDNNCLHWDPATIVAEVHDATGCELQSPLTDRLFAGIALLGTDRFFRHLPSFNELCLVLAGDSHDPRHWEPASAADCAWGLTEAGFLCPEEKDYAEDICAYVGKVCEYEGLLFPPAVLQIGHGLDTLANRVRAQIGHDPALSAAVLRGTEESRRALVEWVRRRTILLFQQLQGLPLRHGQAEEVAQRMLRRLVPSQREESYGQEKAKARPG